MIFIQALGILGALICILSYQCKENRIYYVGQAVSGLCFSIHFFLLGSYTGALLNFINIFRGIGYAAESAKHKRAYGTLLGSSVLYVLATIFTYDGPFALVACAAQLIGSAEMFWGHPIGMRVLQFFFVSPGWILYNGNAGSIGGVLCETFNMVSILVFFLRTRLLPRLKHKQ